MYKLIKKNYYGPIVLILYILIILFSKYFNFFNVNYLELDFLIDSYKKEQTNTYTYRKPIYIVEITDSDVKKYLLGGYYLPRDALIRFLRICENKKVDTVFFDLNLYTTTSEGNRRLEVRDKALIEAINSTSLNIYLIENNESIIYKNIDNSKVHYVSASVEADSDYSVRDFDVSNKNYVTYSLYENVTEKNITDVLKRYTSNWIDQDYSKKIIFKEFINQNSYYSGLSTITFDQFITSPQNYKNSVLLFGRTDIESHDLFNTPIGLMPGVYLHANSLMSLIHYGGIKSYYLLNAAFAFMVGWLYIVFRRYLDSREKVFNELEYELLEGGFMLLLVFVVIVVSYLLFGFYLIWIDFISIALALTLLKMGELLYGGYKILIPKR